MAVKIKSVIDRRYPLEQTSEAHSMAAFSPRDLYYSLWINSSNAVIRGSVSTPFFSILLSILQLECAMFCCQVDFQFYHWVLGKSFNNNFWFDGHFFEEALVNRYCTWRASRCKVIILFSLKFLLEIERHEFYPTPINPPSSLTR